MVRMKLPGVFLLTGMEYRYVKLHKSKLLKIAVHMIPFYLYNSNYSNDLEMRLTFVLSRTSVYCSVQWIRRIGLIQYGISSLHQLQHNLRPALTGSRVSFSGVLRLNFQILLSLSVTVSDSQYAVFNGTENAILIFLNEYAVLDRKLDTPYPMEMDTPYQLSNDNYILYDRVMYPLTAQQERKTRKDYGTKRGRPSSSTSSSSAFGQPSSSHHIDDDNDGNDEGTSRASTPCPTRFVNSLSNAIPQVFSNPPHIDLNMEAFYTR
ncbi:hypothetical protein Tco_0819590 [Tanacetum coccineum]|uniref:Uncharacterized protein n=1 Tax=Tanacetum coccineum TaxID=301880 RepID=A0ABQ5A7V8_9ASTR